MLLTILVATVHLVAVDHWVWDRPSHRFKCRVIWIYFGKYQKYRRTLLLSLETIIPPSLTLQSTLVAQRVYLSFLSISWSFGPLILSPSNDDAVLGTFFLLFGCICLENLPQHKAAQKHLCTLIMVAIMLSRALQQFQLEFSFVSLLLAMVFCFELSLSVHTRSYALVYI